MNGIRYFPHKRWLRNDEIHDRTCHKFMNTDEVVDKLNDGEKYKVLFEIAREIIRNNLSQRYVDYLMRAEFQQFWGDLGNLEPVWGRCRCHMTPIVKEGNNDLEG